MRRIIISDDCFLELCSWLYSIPDVVNLWIALCMQKWGVCHDSQIWISYLKMHYATKGTDIESAILRAGMRFDDAMSMGLQLLKKLYVLRKCGRSGCLKLYREIYNGATECICHPGYLKNNRLTCCKETFKFIGCKSSCHDGSLSESIFAPRESTSLLPPISYPNKSSSVPITHTNLRETLALPQI